MSKDSEHFDWNLGKLRMTDDPKLGRLLEHSFVQLGGGTSKELPFASKRLGEQFPKRVFEDMKRRMGYVGTLE